MCKRNFISTEAVIVLFAECALNAAHTGAQFVWKVLCARMITIGRCAPPEVEIKFSFAYGLIFFSVCKYI